MIGIGVIGYGYWGPNLVRNFAEIRGSQVISVCDRRPERLVRFNERYPSIKTTTDPGTLFSDTSIDAVAIATPVSTHFELAMGALQAGKHVLVEKPMTATTEQAGRLIHESEKHKRVLLVDHTFVYTGAVRKIRDLVAGNDLGDIHYYDSVRVNLGLFQHDVSVIMDLAVHDLSIMDYVLPLQPTAVSATGMGHVPGEPENVAYLTVFFEGHCIGHIHVNWLAPVKVRRTLIGGSRKMIVYDELEPSEKVKVYDKGITLNNDPESVYQMLIDYRVGDVWVPHVDRTEALRTEALHFVDCIEKGEKPLTGGESGMRVVRIIEAAEKSMAKRGELVELNGEG